MNTDDTDEPVRRRTGGRSARVREAVLSATLQAMEADGVAGLTISGIARRSGVHATSIQRRWGTLENVLLDAVLIYSEQTLPIPNTGSLRGDFIAFARLMANYLETPLGKTVMRTMASAQDDSERSNTRAEVLRVRFETASVMAARAIERGEIRPEIEPKFAQELLIGPIYLRGLVTREPIDDDFIERMVDVLLRGLAG
jgi:AcrR family transcriptional regulator